MQGLIPHHCIDYCNYVLSGQFQAILYPIRAVLNTFVLYILCCWRKEVVHAFYLVSCSYRKAFYGKRVGNIHILYFTDGYTWSYLPVHQARNVLINVFLQCSVQFYIQMKNRPSQSFMMGFIHWIFIHFFCNRRHEIVASLKSVVAVGKGFLLQYLHMLIN